MASTRKRFSERIEAATRDRGAAPTPFRPQEPPDQLVETAAFVGATIIGLLVITALAIFFGTRSIESHLETQAIGYLRANGMRNIQVEADGLDLTMVGTVTKAEHLEVLQAIFPLIEGAGRIDASNIVVEPEREVIEIDLTVEPLVFNWDGGLLSVSGTVSDEPTRSVIVATLAEQWSDVMDDGLVVKEGIPSERDWLPSVLRVVQRSGEDLEEGTVVANSDLSFVLVAGELETRHLQVTVTSDIEDILSGVTFDFTSGLTLPPEEQPTSSTVVAGGSTTTSTSSTTTTLPPIVVELQVTLDELIEGKVVEFEFGSAVITTEGRGLLNEVLDALARFPDIRVEIGGHTDDIGSTESNLVLSRLRATSVLSYLVDNGESPARFQIVGYGESRPVDDNATEEGRARNRRIEFTALAE